MILLFILINRIIHKKSNIQNNKTINKDIAIPILNITEDLKGIIKEEFSDTSIESVTTSSFEKAAQVPVMKFTINKNIIIEFFSELEKDF